MRSGVRRAGSGSFTRVEFPPIPRRVVWRSPSAELWQGRFTEAWHQLPQQEQQRLLGLVMEGFERSWGEKLVICSAAWSNERWPFFGVEEFPDLKPYNATNRS